MKKLLLAIVLIVGCASQGFVTPEMKKLMTEKSGNGIPFIITNMGVSRSNSAGGRNLFMTIRVTSNKTIKYIHPTFTAYNEVQDEAQCTIRDRSTSTGKATGPFNFGESEHFRWENAYYNWSIHCIKLISVKVEYMDGSIETYEGDDVTKLYAPEDLRTSANDGRLSKYGTICNW